MKSMSASKKKKLIVSPNQNRTILATSNADSPGTNTSLPSSGTTLTTSAEYADSLKLEKKSPLTFFSLFKMVCALAYREAIRQKGYYLLGFGMIFFVVYLISLLITFVYYSPLVFMSIGEMGEGEIDFLLSPLSSNTASVLNYSMIEHLLPNEFHSPRPDSLNCNVYDASTCSSFNSQNPFNPSYPYTYSSSCRRSSNCLSQLCGSSTTASLYLIDSEREKKATIGRTWSFSTLPRNQVVIDQSLAYSMGVSKGDYLFLVIPIKSSLSYHFDQALNQVKQSDRLFSLPSFTTSSVSVPVQIYAIVDSPNGKFDMSERFFIVMEYTTVIDVLSTHLHIDVPNVFRNALSQTSSTLYDHVDNVLFSKTVPRFNAYLYRRFPSLARSLLDWGNMLQSKIGPTITQSSLPVLTSIYKLNQISSFIDMIVQLIILFLGSLSIFLIYSLLMVSVETKIFHLGILRIVGMNRSALVSLLIVQALFYSAPACLFGLAFSEFTFFFLKSFLENYLRFSFNPFLDPSAVLISIALALLVPIISSIAPIRQAFSIHLYDAISRTRSSTQPTVITINSSKTNPNVMFYAWMGLILSVFGFVIYYFMPMALVNKDFVLLFNIFLFIFVFLILGLVVLADNFQRLAQTLISWILFTVLFVEKQAIKSLVRSNLLIHRLRNRKTSLLYSLALAFVIFISATTKLQLDTLQYNYRRIVGADIIVYSKAYYDDGTPASLGPVTELISFFQTHPWVIDVAWQTWSLAEVTSKFKSTFISNLGQLQSFPISMYGVTSNFFSMMDPIHLSPTSSMSPSLMLYDYDSNHTAVVGAFFRTSFFLSPGDPLLLLIGMETETVKELMYPIFYATSAPVFTMTDRLTPKQDMIVSMPTFLNLTQGQFTSIRDLPLSAGYIKLKPGLSDSQFNKFLSSIQTFLTYERIRDIRSTLSVTNDGRRALDLIFQIASAMIMFFTFFSLNTSMLVNILEQAKEIGIMRSLGLTKYATLRLYFYEALILVLSSVFLGCSVGAIVAVTMALQQSSLTQVPIDPNFNWILIAIVVISSVISALFSTLAPIRSLVFKKSLTSILKDS